MTASGFEPADADSNSDSGQDGTPLEVDADAGRELLEEVVKATVMGDSEDVSPDEMDALLAVARRYHESPLVLQPVAVELVEAVVKVRFADLPIAASPRQAMCYDIAESLLDDAHSQQRLSRFWDRLVEIAT